MHKRRVAHVRPLAVLGAVLALGLTGCSQSMVKESACTLPGRGPASGAFEAAKRELALGACGHRYDAFEQRLFQVAAGDPGEANRKRFHGFYAWSVEQGLLSKLQAKERYSRHFTASYAASLPDGYSNCALGTRKDIVLGALAGEVRDKRRGLHDVLGDRNGYFTAKRRHDDLVFLLGSVALACEG